MFYRRLPFARLLHSWTLHSSWGRYCLLTYRFGGSINPSPIYIRLKSMMSYCISLLLLFCFLFFVGTKINGCAGDPDANNLVPSLFLFESKCCFMSLELFIYQSPIVFFHLSKWLRALEMHITLPRCFEIPSNGFPQPDWHSDNQVKIIYITVLHHSKDRVLLISQSSFLSTLHCPLHCCLLPRQDVRSPGHICTFAATWITFMASDLGAREGKDVEEGRRRNEEASSEMGKMIREEFWSKGDYTGGRNEIESRRKERSRAGTKPRKVQEKGGRTKSKETKGKSVRNAYNKGWELDPKGKNQNREVTITEATPSHSTPKKQESNIIKGKTSVWEN